MKLWEANWVCSDLSRHRLQDRIRHKRWIGWVWGMVWRACRPWERSDACKRSEERKKDWVRRVLDYSAVPREGWWGQCTELMLPSRRVLHNCGKSLLYLVIVCEQPVGNDCGGVSKSHHFGASVIYFPYNKRSEWCIFMVNISTLVAGPLFHGLHLDWHQEKQLCWSQASKSNMPKLHKWQ